MTANTAEAKILRKPMLVSSFQALGMFPILILLALIFQFFSGFKETNNLAAALTSGRFISLQNLSIVAAQASINTVLASGMTFVILTGGIDLSVGSVLALCTVVSALIMTDKSVPAGLSVPLAILGCMGTGAACGAINGWVCEQWKLPSFIVTLGMLNVASGAARVLS